MPNNSHFTPEQIQEILDLYFENFAHRQYIGARYVPIFGRKDEDSIIWDNTKPYEPLTIVLYEGNSYTSRQFVPIGVNITNETFWANTGNYNAQVEQYRQDVMALDAELPGEAFDSTNTVKKYIDDGLDSIKEIIPFDEYDSVNTIYNEDSTRVIGFANVAAMKSNTRIKAGMICHTDGFHSSGDGGAAWYEITDSGTANEIDVIACGDLYANLVITGNKLPIQQFGADPTNTDDASAIIQYVINLALSGTVHTVDFGNGIYKVDNQISFNVPNGSYINLIGENCIVNANMNTNLFSITGRDENFSKISGIKFFGNRSNTCFCFETSANNWSIEKCWFWYFGTCIQTNGESDEWAVTECYFQTFTNYGIKHTAHNASFNVRDCHFRGMPETAIVLDFTTSYSCDIADTVIQSGKRHKAGVFTNCEDISLQNLYLEVNANFADGSLDALTFDTCKNISCKNITSHGVYTHIYNLIASIVDIENPSHHNSGGRPTSIVNADSNSTVRVKLFNDTCGDNSNVFFLGEGRIFCENNFMRMSRIFDSVSRWYGNLSLNGTIEQDISKLETGVYLVSIYCYNQASYWFGLLIRPTAATSTLVKLSESSDAILNPSITNDGTILECVKTYGGTQTYSLNILPINGYTRPEYSKYFPGTNP